MTKETPMCVVGSVPGVLIRRMGGGLSNSLNSKVCRCKLLEILLNVNQAIECIKVSCELSLLSTTVGSNENLAFK